MITIGSGGFTPPLGLIVRPLTLNLGTSVNLDSPAWLQVGVRTTVGHRMITIVPGSKVGGVGSGRRHQWMYFHGQGPIALDLRLLRKATPGSLQLVLLATGDNGTTSSLIVPLHYAVPSTVSISLGTGTQPLGVSVRPRTLVLATNVSLDGPARLRIGVRTTVGHRMITIVRGSTVGGAKSGKRHQWLSYQGKGKGTIALSLRLLRKATPGKLQLVLLAKGENGKTTTLVVPVRNAAP